MLEFSGTSFCLLTSEFCLFRAAAVLSGPAPLEARFRGFAADYAALPSLLLHRGVRDFRLMLIGFVPYFGQVEIPDRT